MSDFKLLFEEKWKQLPEDVKVKAIMVLREQFSPELKEELRRMIAANPDGWISSHHFGWGMSVRNLLREKGLTDDMTPDGNWDDYYVKVVEAAVA